MIGTSFFLGNAGISLNKEILQKLPSHKAIQLFASEGCDYCYSYYDDYPIKEWDSNECKIVLEGAIFNIHEGEIETCLNRISLDFKENDENLYKDIDSFVRKADGDFVISIFDVKDKRFLVFNDMLGGMSLYYTYNETHLILSRSLSYVACNQDNLNLSRENCVEYITWGYNVGDHTIYDGIKKMTPGTCLIAFMKEGAVVVNCKTIIPQDFSIHNKFKNKKEAIECITKQFLEGCKNRVDYALSHGYKIINTMSGGFDSRTVMGGVESLKINYTNLTGEYKQDESEVALKVLKHVESSSTFVKMKFANEPHIDDSSITFKTDGKVDAHTNSVCWNDLTYEKEFFKGEKIALFGGFGGEFIRHPLRQYLLPPSYWGWSNNPPLSKTSKMCSVPLKDARRHFSENFNCLIKRGREEEVKFFYNEYYQNLVRCSGEERNRMFFFSVQPLMTKDFILSIRNRIPLNWVGFDFYRDFLNEIDPRLTEVELFGNAVDIKSRKSLVKKDLENKLRIRTCARFIRNIMPAWKNKRFKPFVDFDQIKYFWNKLDNKNIFDFEYIQEIYTSLGGNAQLRLLTLLEYIYECEKSIKRQ